MTDGIEAVRALNLPGCPTAHFLTDLSEALAVPSLRGTWWVPRVLGAYWGGFHGRGSGQPHGPSGGQGTEAQEVAPSQDLGEPGRSVQGGQLTFINPADNF